MIFFGRALLAFGLTSMGLGVSSVQDGKCHSNFIECAVLCQLACSGNSIANDDFHGRVHSELRSHGGWSALEKCDLTDFEHDVRVNDIVDHLRTWIASLVGREAPSSENKVERFNTYNSIGTRNPDLFSWTCQDHCKYECMHHVASEFEPRVKFFGKWPFRRVFICQEILSSVHSIFNAIPYMILLSWRSFRSWDSFTVYALIMTIMWSASAVFHCRDTWLTMHVDYFSAFGGILTNGWFPLYMMLSNRARIYQTTLTIVMWLAHASYMTIVKFDFDLNMKIAVIMGLYANSMWTVWYMKNRGKQRPYAWLAPFNAWIIVPMFLLMEANDFPPTTLFGLADAHAYWHLATVPVSVLWAVFLWRESRVLKLKEE